MVASHISSLLLLAVVSSASSALVSQQVGSIRISEICSDNRGGARDADGLASDWIEIFNEAHVPIVLTGCQLVSEADRPFVFPSTLIAPRGFVVVFASGKDRAVTGEPLHTGFRLSRKGEWVRLLSPSGNLIDEMDYPSAPTDASVGLPQARVLNELITHASRGRYFVPTEELVRGWHKPSFDDSAWRDGVGGFGFDLTDPPALVLTQATDIAAAVRGKSTTICYRYTFDAPNPKKHSQLLLDVRARGGFVAYLNGIEVARRFVDGKPEFDARAVEDSQDRGAGRVVSIDLHKHVPRLRSTGNVLAFLAVNEHRFVARHLLQPRLTLSYLDSVVDGPLATFAEPTPGQANGVGHAGMPGQPKLEPSCGLFEDSITVAIQGGDEASVIRYTLDGSDPTGDSPECPSSLDLTESCELRVRKFVGGIGSRVTASQYAKADPGLRSFSSDLPLLVAVTNGRNIPVKEYTSAQLHVYAEGEAGRATLSSGSALSCRSAIKLRGSSTLHLAKKCYGLELRDRRGADRSRPILGMPAGSDWVLHGPHHWDQAHIRNALCYELARRIGLDTPRCKFVELFVCDDGADVSQRHYRGLYLLVERIAIDKDRLAIDKLKASDSEEPDISGGYVFKVDRPGRWELGFEAGDEELKYVDPPEHEVTDVQRQWLSDYLNRMSEGFGEAARRDPQSHYSAYLDTERAIDYHLFQELVNNPDAFTLSTYFYKPRGGKVRAGPVWDFDRALRTNDKEYWLGREGDPIGWTSDSEHGWWGELFDDPDFERRYRVRGRELLSTVWTVAEVHALIDELAAEIQEAEQRDRARWPIMKPNEWEDEIARLKGYVAKRIGWFRAELLESPDLRREGDGSNFRLHIKSGHPEGTLYYTTNGADPVLKSHEPSPHAKVYTGPLQVSGEFVVKARTRVGDLWSRRSDWLEWGDVPALRISEVMCDPVGGREYEFIEIFNDGDTEVDLAGLRLRGNVAFAFSMGDVQTLPPKSALVLVQHLPSFATRYDTNAMTIAGTFYGRCGDGPGKVVLVGSVGQEISRAEYNREWFHKASGREYSLQAKSQNTRLEVPTDWELSSERFGSPGRL